MQIPSAMPFRVEIWRPGGAGLLETLAASSHLLVARAAFMAACEARPNDLVRLCNLAQIILERPPGAAPRA